MNIHVDKDMFETLIGSTIGSYQFGSTVYGTTTQDSDVDVLHIFVPSLEHEMSYVWDNSMFQYKDGNVDHIFTTIDVFIRNLLIGDSTINFEILHGDIGEFKQLAYLFKNKDMFYNYSIVRAYLGFAKRDLKMAKEGNNKLSHAVRGYYAASDIMIGEYGLSFSNELVEFVKDLKGKYDSDLKKSYIGKVERLRDQLNRKLDNGEITRYASPVRLQELDRFVVDLKRSAWYNSFRSEYDLAAIYDRLENGVKYD